MIKFNLTQLAQLIWIALISTSLLYSEKNPMEVGYSVIYSVEDEKWEDINYEIKAAIKDKGIVISYTSHAKEMLDRTAKTVGIKQDVYENAEMHLFCNISLSHKMIHKNPHIISGCPYSISVYELKNKKNTIYVSYRKPPKNEKAYEDVIKLQIEIIKEVIDF